MENGTHVKSVKYNVEVTVKKTVNQLYIYSTALRAAINIGKWEAYKKFEKYIEYICSA